MTKLARTLAVALCSTILLAAPDSGVAQGKKCYHNGQPYDEGARVGETVCRDGSWVEEE